MSGFYGVSADDDREVEKLLDQVQDESLLKLSLNNHRSTNGFQAPSLPSSAALHGDDCGGLESNLLVRFANLKSRPVQPTGKESKGKDGATDRTDTALPKARVGDNAEAESEKDEDVLMAELEERLTALKPGLQASSHSSNWAQPQSGLSSKSSSSPSSIHSSSPSLQTSPTTSRSFSPLKLLKQFSGAKRAPAKTRSMNDRIFSTDDYSVKHCISKDRAHTAPVDKLLASAVDEVMLERKKGRPKKHVEEEEEDDFDIFDEGSLLHGDLKDLNLKQLKKELSKASVEEDRLSREAAEVIEWAKDAARLDPPSGIDGDDADLEELLKLEDQQDEARLNDQKKKKKKGKKWSLF